MWRDAIMRVMSQMFSGRWLLTIAAANGLLAITFTLCWQAMHGQQPFMDPAGVLAVYTMVFLNYFQKPSTNESKPPHPPAAEVTVKR